MTHRNKSVIFLSLFDILNLQNQSDDFIIALVETSMTLVNRFIEKHKKSGRVHCSICWSLLVLLINNHSPGCHHIFKEFDDATKNYEEENDKYSEEKTESSLKYFYFIIPEQFFSSLMPLFAQSNRALMIDSSEGKKSVIYPSLFNILSCKINLMTEL